MSSIQKERDDVHRVDGPTPSGGVYSTMQTMDDGTVEIIEYSKDDKEIRRTYA